MKNVSVWVLGLILLVFAMQIGGVLDFSTFQSDSFTYVKSMERFTGTELDDRLSDGWIAVPEISKYYTATPNFMIGDTQLSMNSLPKLEYFGEIKETATFNTEWWSSKVRFGDFVYPFVKSGDTLSFGEYISATYLLTGDFKFTDDKYDKIKTYKSINQHLLFDIDMIDGFNTRLFDEKQVLGQGDDHFLQIIVDNKLANNIKGGFVVKHNPVLTSQKTLVYDYDFELGDNIINIPVSTESTGVTSYEITTFIIIDQPFANVYFYGEDENVHYKEYEVKPQTFFERPTGKVTKFVEERSIPTITADEGLSKAVKSFSPYFVLLIFAILIFIIYFIWVT